MTNKPAATERSSADEAACKRPGEDVCDWSYDGGDYSVGINPGWICATCDAVDVERDPPSDPDADAYERNR